MIDLTIKIWKTFPLSPEQAAEEVISHLSDEEKQLIKAASRDELISYHDSLGRLIRNNLNIWAYFRGRENSIPNPDTISLQIIYAVWERLNQIKIKLAFFLHYYL